MVALVRIPAFFWASIFFHMSNDIVLFLLGYKETLLSKVIKVYPIDYVDKVDLRRECM